MPTSLLLDKIKMKYKCSLISGFAYINKEGNSFQYESKLGFNDTDNTPCV